MEETVKLEITPYNALAILSFLREFIDKDCKDYKLQAITEAVKEYEDQVYKKVTPDHLTSCEIENQVNQALGRSPKRENQNG